MATLFISLLTLVLLLISGYVIMIVLMQRTSQSGGMGAALGGGAAESAFGSDTNNILTKGTIYGIIAFFLVSLGLYLIYQAQAAERAPDVDMNTLITADQMEEGAGGMESALETAADEAEGTMEAAADEAEVTVEAVSGSVEEATAAGDEATATPQN